MVDIDVTQFRKLYLTTALEYTTKIEDQLKNLLHQQTPDAVNEIFIAAHSLKSQSLIMGYTFLADAAFSLEKVYRASKDTATAVPSDILNETGVLISFIRSSLEKILSGGQEENISPATNSFKKLAGIE